MIWSAYMGLPLSLEGVGAILKLQDQKLKEGKDLIRYFCTPCKPTKANGGRTRNLPKHDTEKWELFKKYNFADKVSLFKYRRGSSVNVYHLEDYYDYYSEWFEDGYASGDYTYEYDGTSGYFLMNGCDYDGYYTMYGGIYLTDNVFILALSYEGQDSDLDYFMNTCGLPLP